MTCLSNCDLVPQIYRISVKNRSTSLTHFIECFQNFQQGGSPSPFDRNLATTLASTATRWIVEKAEANVTDGKVVTGDKDSAVLLGLCRRAKLFLPVQVNWILLLNTSF